MICSKNKKKQYVNIGLLICILVSICLITGHYFNQLIFILLSFLTLIILIFKVQLNQKLSILFYFLPYALILKTSPSSISFFTFLVPFVILTFFINTNFKIKIKKICFIIFLFFVSYNFFQLIFTPLDQQIINFLVSLLLVLIVISNEKSLVNFNEIINFYSIGVLTSAMGALIIRNQPHIFAYFNSIKGLDELRRFTGMNYDPNYYATQVLIAITLLILKIYYCKEKNKNYISIILILILVLLGGMSISKTYMLILVFILMFLFFLSTKHVFAKLKWLIITIIVASMIGNTQIFEKIINEYILRLNVSNFNDLTTGRADLVFIYLNEIFKNNFNLFIGKGISSYPIISIGTGTHNLYLELLFHLGVIGTTLLIIFLLVSYFSMNIKLSKIKLINTLTILVIVISGFSLQLLFMAEFPFYIIISLFSIMYSSEIKLD